MKQMPLKRNASLTVKFIIAACMAAILFCPPARAMEFPPVTISDPDVRTDRLCDEAANPDAAPDKVHIHCRLEYGIFATDTRRGMAAAPYNADESAKRHELLVVAYNLERGMKLDRQIELLRNDADFGRPDIMMISEADRGCSRTNYRNVTRDLAKALGMNYVFGVEFIELPRKSAHLVGSIDTVCEHGNAVLSRYPILGAEQIRHAKTSEWYVPPGPGRDNMEPRLGGGMAVAVDVDVDGAPVRVYAVHLDSNVEMNDARGSQAREIIAHAGGFNGPIVIGGDMNSYAYMSDYMNGGHDDAATSEFLAAGYLDAHAALPARKRSTLNREYPFPATIDAIFLKGPEPVRSGVCPLKTCGPLSDHLPIWTRVKF